MANKMQVEHKTEKGTVLFVKVPADSREIELLGVKTQVISCLSATRSPKWYSDVLPIGFQLIGLTSEITEEMAKMMVDKVTYRYFMHYKHNLNRIKNAKKTALESFKSLMDFKEVFEINPYQELMRYLNEQSDSGLYDLNKTKYDKAQCRSGKWIVLFKPKI